MSWFSGKVAVALDGSTPSNEALRYAAELAARLGVGLVLLHVIEAHKVGYWRFIDEHFRKELERRADDVMLAGRKEAARHRVDVTVVVLQGEEKGTHEALAEYLAANPAISHIIMGDHGIGLTERHAVGSTTERLIRGVSDRGLSVATVVVPGRGSEAAS
jgi:nucleotide-binding universal stress UspA family protein